MEKRAVQTGEISGALRSGDGRIVRYSAVLYDREEGYVVQQLD